MSALSDRPEWQALVQHADALCGVALRDLFAAESARFPLFSLRHGEWLLDFSKQRITSETWARLHTFAQQSHWRSQVEAMRSGARLNHTEDRAALHCALRAPPNSPDALPEVGEMLAKIGAFCESIHRGVWRGFGGERITDVVNLGVGGSDLGPRMAVRALAAWQQPDLHVHFVANVDGGDLAATLAELNPRTTLFIVASKTFSTLETMANARTARDWLLAASHDERAVAKHFVAVSANPQAAADFGIAPDNVFAFRDWVGGRFSLWSPVGLSIALAIGFGHFRDLLAGAHDMDLHFFHAPDRENLPLTLALLTLWNASLLNIGSHAVLPYSQSLALLPAHLQQLEMESTGKQVGRSGLPVGVPTSPILWGEAGTNGQHSFYQLLHQGSRPTSCDFIVLKEADFPLPGHHEKLLANCLAQSAALAFGQTDEEARAAGCPETLLPYRVFPGNQPSSTILMPRLTPFTLGQLVALYEHKVFCLGALWGINVFDQWGVELGKTLAGKLEPLVRGEALPKGLDSSSLGLLAALRGE